MEKYIMKGTITMSQEKVREILSHVDMTKIDLSSFKLSEKKFNELSHLYRNRVIISCFAIIHCPESPREEFSVAYEMLEKVVNNPDLYTYANIYSMERQAVDKAIDDITYFRDRSINDIKIKSIEKRMKDAYKQMRKTLELALENDNLEQEFDEELVEKCLNMAQAIFDAYKRKEAERALREAQAMEEGIKMKIWADSTAVKAQESAEQILQEVSHIETPKRGPEKEKIKPKAGFWKRIFRKHEVSANV
jgi:hypothetical protein